MSHPYKKYENTELWLILENALNDLSGNQDILLKTNPEYVIGYLCKCLMQAKPKEFYLSD